jgi:hypothetical protein
MNDQNMLDTFGVFPTYLNFSSSDRDFQIPVEPSVRLVDFSSYHNTFLVCQEPVELKQGVTYM